MNNNFIKFMVKTPDPKKVNGYKYCRPFIDANYGQGLKTWVKKIDSSGNIKFCFDSIYYTKRNNQWKAQMKLDKLEESMIELGSSAGLSIKQITRKILKHREFVRNIRNDNTLLNALKIMGKNETK